MSGRKPDFDVVIAQEYLVGTEKRTRWWKVGAAWTNAKGISLTLCTMPGVSLVLFPAESDASPRAGGGGKDEDKF